MEVELAVLDVEVKMEVKVVLLLRSPLTQCYSEGS
jgi:hypothetical protein